MENYKGGTVLFDRITVLGKDFLSGSYKDDLAVYQFGFDVTPRVKPLEGKKKNAVPQYEYMWEGFFNLSMNSIRIRLHPVRDDLGLFQMEQKLTLLKEKFEFFVKELKARRKTPAKKVLNDKVWLNKADSSFTGYISSTIYEDGSGQLAIADCHKAIHWYPEGWHDEKGKQHFDENYTLALKSVDDFAKAAGKAVKAIQELRKFFAREMESTQA